MRFLRLFLLLALSALSACSSTTAELRADPGETKTFTLDLPYKVALGNYVTTGQNCYTGGLESSYFYLVVKENDEETAARVDYVQDGMARRVHLSTDFVAQGDQTKITYYKQAALFNFIDTQKQITEWASAPKKCDGWF